jgi:peptidoglycan hydrolase-like protein with peptidoglycan-binding domain
VEGAWHALHHSLGNQGAGRLLASGRHSQDLPPPLQRVVQRALSAKEKAKDLKAARFAGDPQLEDAFDNSPPLRWGSRGDGVAKVQQALIDSGFQMPISTRKSGSPDGIYGKETWGTVKQFQGIHSLKVDGKVGRETMGRLDAMYAGPKPSKSTPTSMRQNTKRTRSTIRGIRISARDSPTRPIGYAPTTSSGCSSRG